MNIYHGIGNPEAPIGVLDSGIGGLTIASAIAKLLPEEQLVFFGDTSHLPYGDKSPESIRQYVHKITDFLFDQGCKVVVIACNSASAAAYGTLKKVHGKESPILNVVDPLVQAICHGTEGKTVGVIGTKATISSKIYSKKINKEKAGLDVRSMATPLLAPMIEEGFYNNKISQTVINAYLDAKKLQGIDTLGLACTHYPLIINEIEAYYKSKKQVVQVLDSIALTAEYVKEYLTSNGLIHPSSKTEALEKRTHKFYVSDYTQSFESTTEIFFGERISLEHYPIWGGKGKLTA